jgi:hypothetical protein
VIASIRRRYPGAPAAYSERVPGYLLQAAGLTVVTPLGFATAIEDGDEPSAGATPEMFQLITSHGTKVLLYNALAQQYGVPVVPVTETMPPSFRSYQACSSPRPRPCSTRWEGEMTGDAVTLRGATLRFRQHVIWPDSRGCCCWWASRCCPSTRPPSKR